ncbi:GM24616 [Drosophila sechellia]|uniref:GM24616 n=1 Tax=Drosophila sechellia TaxID=7238 RepID=B4HGN0_DROSE|nr:GM24616 [Drosophila sechellia]
MNRNDRMNDYMVSMADLSNNILQVVSQIFDDNTSFDGQRIMHLYHLIYKQCTERNWNAPAQNNGRTLYIFLTDFLKERLQNLAMEIENRFDGVKPIRLISQYVEQWVPYQRSCEKLDLACYHFNRNWVKQERFKGDQETYPIYRLAMMSWKKLVFEPSITILTAIRQILSQMPREDSKSLVYQVLQSIVELYANDEYQDVSLSSRIDKIFIDKVMDFYKSTTLHEFQKILVSNDYTDFKHFLKYACLAMPEIENGKQFKAILKRHLAARLQQTIKSLSGKEYIKAILGFRQGPLQQALREHKRLADIVDEMAVLMLFNRHERFTEQELVTALGVDLETLQEALKQIKILVYSGPFIKVNMDFTNRKRRLILNKRLLTKRRKIEEKGDDLKLRRDKQVDAAIVRIMKGKKELEYSQLISHVYEELKDRIKPQVSSIKERLDDLVKREYLERCDNNTYRYL